MADMRDVWVAAHNLTLRGTSYSKGARVSLDVASPRVRALIDDRSLSLCPPMPRASVDKRAEIEHNSAEIPKSKAGRNGRKRNSKSRSVRDSGTPVPEGLSGAESSD